MVDARSFTLRLASVTNGTGGWHVTLSVVAGVMPQGTYDFADLLGQDLPPTVLGPYEAGATITDTDVTDGASVRVQIVSGPDGITADFGLTAGTQTQSDFVVSYIHRAPPVAAALAQVLNDAGCGVYSPDAPIPDAAVPISIAGFTGTHPVCIAVTTYAGAMPPDSREGDEFPRLQVRVKAPDPMRAYELERDCWTALQFTTTGPRPRQIDPDWWLQDCYAIQSEAEPLGRGDDGGWEFVRNYQLHVNTTP